MASIASSVSTHQAHSVPPQTHLDKTHLLEAFLLFLDTGKESVPIEEEVELIAALEAAKSDH